jgi:hypothetical protein
MMKVDVRITGDKPGRVVTVEADAVGAGSITLEVGGLIGQSQWTWLAGAEAREIAAALERAANIADEEPGDD